jgi:Uma2 family endonuclease
MVYVNEHGTQSDLNDCVINGRDGGACQANARHGPARFGTGHHVGCTTPAKDAAALPARSVLMSTSVAARPSRANITTVTSLRARSLQHVRPVVPLEFPSSEPDSERMGQSGRHYRMLSALYQILREAAGPEHTVSCDAFVYFDAANPRRVLAPDGAIKLDVFQHDFDSWKTWERGAPELAFEILSPSDSPERWTFEEKLERYRALGVVELVTFHADGEPGSRLRVWDRIDGDLVERTVDAERTPCLTLDAFLVVAPVGDLPACLRLARDPKGQDLVPTSEEARHAAEATARASEESRREADQAKHAAEARLREAERKIAELERAASRKDS